jgi:hypothetical protein
MYSVLLTAIALWISANFDLPANVPLPNVRLVSAQEITFLRYGAFTSAQQREVANQEEQTSGVLNRRQAVAVYDDLNDPGLHIVRHQATEEAFAQAIKLAKAKYGRCP